MTSFWNAQTDWVVAGAEGAVDRPGVEAEIDQALLEPLDVVAVHALRQRAGERHLRRAAGGSGGRIDHREHGFVDDRGGNEFADRGRSAAGAGRVVAGAAEHAGTDHHGEDERGDDRRRPLP